MLKKRAESRARWRGTKARAFGTGQRRRLRGICAAAKPSGKVPERFGGRTAGITRLARTENLKGAKR